MVKKKPNPIIDWEYISSLNCKFLTSILTFENIFKYIYKNTIIHI